MLKALIYIYHLGLALAGAVIYKFPSEKIFVIGITGTKGKTTVVELLSHVLTVAGHKTAFISSSHVKIGEDVRKNMTGNSMPGRFFIQNFLRRAVAVGCRYAIVEVTSQGVMQSRHRFIDFNAAIFTNLEPEHIEAHGSFEKYREAKIDFFRTVARSRKSPKYFVINRDDESARYFEEAAKGGKIIPFSAHYASGVAHGGNIGAVSIFAYALGIDHHTMILALESWQGVSGRMEVVQQKPLQVVVDYAHTPKSLELLYQHLKGEKAKKKKLICVLGAAGGGRDRWKRKKFGEIAATYCDEIILTNEDPYDEDPASILEEIASGISGERSVHKILARGEAIRMAISLAEKGDIVAVTGKGSESFIHEANEKKIPWSEREVVESILKGE